MSGHPHTLFIYTFRIWIYGCFTGSIVNGLFLDLNIYNKNLGGCSEARLYFMQEFFEIYRAGL